MIEIASSRKRFIFWGDMIQSVLLTFLTLIKITSRQFILNFNQNLFLLMNKLDDVMLLT